MLIFLPIVKRPGQCLKHLLWGNRMRQCARQRSARRRRSTLRCARRAAATQGDAGDLRVMSSRQVRLLGLRMADR